METKVFKVTKDSLNILSEASVLLNSGALVAFPTETVYGLGANAFDAEACRSIFLAKGRPSDNPLIVHVERPQDAEKIAYTCELYYKLAERFMPGPLTVILPKRDIIPPEVTAGLDTVAIRCPRNEVANALLKTSKIPIAAPSANASGRPSPTSAKHVFDDLNGKIPLILDGGECEFGVESTVDGGLAEVAQNHLAVTVLVNILPGTEHRVGESLLEVELAHRGDGSSETALGNSFTHSVDTFVVFVQAVVVPHHLGVGSESTAGHRAEDDLGGNLH